MRDLLSFLISIGMLASSVLAQSFYGSVVGTITDASGAAVPGATITLSSKGTADVRTLHSDGSGNYQFPGLVPGSYVIAIEATGFKRLSRTEIQVEVASVARVDAEMQLGDVTQTVEVSAQASLIQTETSSVSQSVAGRSVLEMPLNGRNAMNLVALVPGVTPGGTFMGSATLNQGTSTNSGSFGNYQAGGGQPNTGGALIDGASIIISNYHSIGLVLTQDAIQEFRVQLNNVEPEYGQAANGVINFTTKSGTNEFHGSVYEYLRNRALNTNSFFNNRNGLERPLFTQNQFGANLGGPIIKNKTFFFFTYEGYRLRVGNTQSLSVPTALQRAGNFSNTRSANGNLITIYDPATGVPRTPFPGNIIPPDRLNNAAKANLRFWALPNAPGAAFTGVNNYNVNAPQRGLQKQVNFRFDHNVSDKQRLFGRFTHWEITTDALDPMNIGTANTDYQTTHNAVLGDSYTLNSTTLLDARVSYLRWYKNSQHPLLGIDYTTLGWPASYNNQVQLRSPLSMQVQGLVASASGSSNPVLLGMSETQSASGGVTKIMGRHTLKFGGEYRRIQNNQGQAAGSNVLTFTNLFTAINPATPAGTGVAFASYMLGLGSGGSILNYTFVAQQEIYAGLYVGDTYRVTNKLTLNLGVRWENPGYWTERHDRATVFYTKELNPVVKSLGLQYPGDVVLVNSDRYPDRHNMKPHYNLFEPRVGLAYRATVSTVIRAGFGTTHFPNDVYRDMAPIGSPVNFASTVWVPTLDGSQTPASTLDNPFPSGINQTLGRSPSYAAELIGRQIVTPIPSDPAGYVAQWNFGMERELGDGAMVGASYVASRGIHLPGGFRSGAVGTSLSQIPDQYLSLGSQLLQQVRNPFYPNVKAGVLSGQTVPYGQLLTPYPQYAGVYSPNLMAYDSNYHSLQAKFQKRFREGASIMAAYTWAKNIGTTDNPTSYVESNGAPFGTVQNFNDIRGSRSELSFSVPHRLVVSYVLDLPVGKGKKFLGGAQGLTDKIVSGWGVSGVTAFQVGYPLPFQAQPSAIQTQFYGGEIRPNVVAGCEKEIPGRTQDKLAKWFNTACYSQPSQFAFGTQSRTDPDLRAPGVANWDVVLFKNTSITERVRLQFHAEVFNLANRVQFMPPGTVLGNAQFGVVSAQRNQPRLVQLSLRLTF